MQTTLLGLAIAIILALLAALIAPLVIDWNHYRTAFEEEAGRLTGLTVRVNGGIDVRVLPTPHIKLHDVAIGEPGRARAQAALVDLEVGLGPLLRGEMQARELRLVAPQISVGLDPSGTINWPALPAALRADAFTISRFTIEDGRLTLTDAVSGSRLVLEKLTFDGDVRSFAGPFRGEGSFIAADEPCRYRIAGGRLDEDGALKLKLGVEPDDYPLATAIDGTLSVRAGLPQFDGTLSVARPAGVALPSGQRVMNDPWQLSGKIRATGTSASLRNLALQYGPEERAVNVAGEADVEFGPHPRLEGTASAVDLDVDRILAAPDVTRRPPFVLLKDFLEAFVGTVRPPLPVAVRISSDVVTVGGTAIQSVHGNVAFDASGWRVEDLALRAPGFTDVNLSGRLGDDSQRPGFVGPISVESADVRALMAWLEGRADQPSGPAQTLRARGDITIAGDRLAFDGLSATLGQETMQGRLAYIWAAAGRPAALDGALRAADLDVDALLAFAKAAAVGDAFEMPRQVALVLDVDKATLGGVDVRKVDASLKFDAGIMHIDRLSVADLGGAALDMTGRIDQLSSRPTGRLTLDIDAATLAGLSGIVGKFAPGVAAQLRPFVDRLAPVKVHGTLSVDHAGTAATAAKLDLSGGVGALRLALHGEATGEPAQLSAASVHVTSRLDADDGGAVLKLLDLDRIAAVDQLPGELTLSLSGPVDGDLQVNGLATAGGFSAAAVGALHLTGRQAPSGNLQLKAAMADLRPLQRMLTGQAGTVAAPVSATAIIGIAGADLSITDLAVTAGTSSLRGRLDLKLSHPVGIGGELTAADIDATAAAALLLGLPGAAGNSGARWSSAPIGAGAFAALNGDVAFRLDRAVLTPSLTAHALAGVLRFQPSEIALRGIEGSLGGGRLSGEFVFRHDGERLAGQGNVELANAKAASLVGGGNAVDGSLTFKLQGETIGSSLDGVIGALHGTGSIALTDGHFGGLDPAVFAAAMRAADEGGQVDMAKQVMPLVSAMMDKGRLAVPQGNAEVTMTGGQIRLAATSLPANGGATLSLEGVLDLGNASIDARMVLSGQLQANALLDTRPEVAVTLKGPLAAPERRVDLSALLGWLTLRATEQQTRRLESIEANSRADAWGPAMRPTPPFVRFVPQGTVLEVTSKPGAAAGTAEAHAFDRLRPAAPPAAPADPGERGAATAPAPAAVRPAAVRRSVGNRATAATAAVPPGAQPAARAPLDLLFHSQN